ncbi:MAG TPA: YceI family protein [Phenylobacterium sp.]|nr:YceI family protein [Phenylobacterium sp.]
MSVAQARDRYSTVAIVLHWLIAGAIVFQVLVAWRMHDLKTPLGFALTQLHKSVGITVLVLSLARLAWRLMNPPPPEPAGLATWERVLSKAVHVLLYAIMIGMPITGWIMVSASRIQIPTLLYGTIPWPHLPIADLPAQARAPWRTIGSEGHEWLAFGAYGLILLHVAGALKHQLLDRATPVLSRMAPGARPGRWFDPRLLLIAAAAAGVITAAELIVPPLPASAPLPPPSLAPAAAETPAAVPPPPAVAPMTEAPAAPAPAPAAAEPSRWTVAPGSTLSFSTSWSGQAIDGRFDRWSADVVFGPEALARSKVRVSIDLASVSTGDPQRDQTLSTADWFGADTHPQATFTADRFEKKGEGRYVAHGQLTLRDATRPADLPFTLKIDGDKARMSGVTTLDRTAFGVGQGEWQATDQIPASVKVSVQLTATRR